VIEETDSTREGLYSLYRLEQAQTAEPSNIGMQALWLSSLSSAVTSAVLPADALQLFLDRLEWQSPLLKDFPHLKLHLNLDQSDQLQAIAQSIQTSIAETALPQSWSQDWFKHLQAWGEGCICLTPSLWLPPECDRLMGLADLITPQYCRLQPEALTAGIKQIWAQLFQAQILYLWEQSGLPFGRLRWAIILQPVLPTTASGWLRLTPDHLLIQATPGLHLSLVLGEARPDQFQLNRHTGEVQTDRGDHPYAYQLHDAAIALQSTTQKSALKKTDLPSFVALAAAVEAQLPAGICSIRWSLSQASNPHLQICEAAPESPVPWVELARPETAEPLTLARGLPATPGSAIASTLVTQNLQAQPLESVTGTILVVPHCQPSDLPWLKRAAGLICETGGLTSHGAILARELGLPAILGLSKATSNLKTGQLIGLDGDRGVLYDRPDPEQMLRPAAPFAPLEKTLNTQVWVTLSQSHTADAASQLPVDGVGLLRSEWLLMDLLQHHHPQQWIEQGKQALLRASLGERLQMFLQAFAPRPVFYRTLDGSTRELAGLKGGEIEPLEANPALGLRGVARYQADPRLFDCELAALAELQRQGWDNLRLLLPFVRSVEEFVWCCDRISTAGLFAFTSFEVWIMAEVPSVLFLLEDYVKAGVQGIAIGSNDLTQLILGVDRDQPLLDDALNASHPAVMAAMSQMIQTARHLKIPCSLCGQVQHQLIHKLVEWGITAISVEMQAVSQTRQAIAEAEQKLLFERLQEIGP
jgi:pyruvate, water dikinase